MKPEQIDDENCVQISEDPTTLPFDTVFSVDRLHVSLSGNADRGRRIDMNEPDAMGQFRYHHLGIPTSIPREGEVYLERFKMYVSGFETSRFGVEWIRFEPDAPFPEIVKTVPHLAFVVDDLEAAIEGRELLIPPNSPSAGTRVAFVVENDAPIEFLAFDSPESEIWPGHLL